MQRASVEGSVHQKWIQHPKASFHDNTCFDVHGPCNVTVHRSTFIVHRRSSPGRPPVISNNDSSNWILPLPSPPHFVSAHICSIYSYPPHIPQYSCPLNLARYILLGRIDQPFYCLCPLWSLQHPQLLHLTRILLSPSLIRVPLPALSPLPVLLSLPFLPLDFPVRQLQLHNPYLPVPRWSVSQRPWYHQRHRPLYPIRLLGFKLILSHPVCPLQIKTTLASRVYLMSTSMAFHPIFRRSGFMRSQRTLVASSV